ncbi:MAG: hypothetical protein ABJA81_03600 [Nocardioidaceae bacterium]
MGSFERSGEVLDDPMPNRVTPLGDIVSVPLRGAWLGNRGILHEGTDVVRPHRGPLWIICALEHKDWRLPQWQPGHFTVLFFHDEAVALAAGHRPCALCRRSSYDEFRAAWVAGNGGAQPLAHLIDRRLHGERLVHRTRQKRLHPMPWSSLPDGAFVTAEGQAMLILGDLLVPWRTIGYGFARPRPRHGQVDVVTPPSTVEALRAGYRPQIDDRALSQAALATT